MGLLENILSLLPKQIKHLETQNINIKDYGASTVPNFDNTPIINKCIEICVLTGKELFIPVGNFECKTPVVFDGSFNINSTGILMYTGSVEMDGAFITIGNPLVHNAYMNHFFRMVTSQKYVPTNVKFTGIEFINISNSKIEVLGVQYFGTGITFKGMNAGHITWNTVLMPLVYGCIDGMKFLADSPSWINQNTFINGGIYSPPSEGRGIVIDEVADFNSNEFLHTSVEMGVNGKWGIYCNANAYANTYRSIRNELNGTDGSKFAFFGGNSRENTIIVQAQGLARSWGVDSENPTNKYLSEKTFTNYITDDFIMVEQKADETKISIDINKIIAYIK